MFRRICKMDLEGIVGKHKRAPYEVTLPAWVKIKNPTYSQAIGRHETFKPKKPPTRADPFAIQAESRSEFRPA